MDHTSLIRDRYEPLEVVGRGGQGEVLRARDVLHERPVALKIREAGADVDRKTLLLEARILLGLKPHSGVPLVREDFFWDDKYVLAMDWIEGDSLASYLAANGAPGLPFDRVVAWLSDVAGALEHLHGHDKPIVHGDVKPANIIVTPDQRAVLVDFGISLRGSDIKSPGSAGYRAPELFGEGRPTPRSDIYAFSATALTLLTGSAPELGMNPDWSGVPEAHRAQVIDAIKSGMALDASKRPATVRALMSRLVPPPTPNNLPAPVTSFIGRRREMDDVKDRLSHGRLLTLTASGGVGKTRVATEVAHEVLVEFPDGVWFTELAGLRKEDEVSRELARTMGLMDEPGQLIDETITGSIGGSRVLVILDNCEHLLESTARFADGLLRACPNLKVIATSRERLAMLGEAAYALPGLEVPDGNATLNVAEQTEAVRLFVARARAVDHTFVLDHANASAVIEIANRLEGVPLAIELAAAHVDDIDVQEIATQVSTNLDLLSGGNRSALPRHQALRATIEWSFELLSEEERDMFVRLSVFVGGFTIEAAEVTCFERVQDKGEAQRIVDSLVMKSLVRREPLDEMRYGMLETVRAFAAEHLASSSEEREVRRRHFFWYRRFCAQASEEGTGPDEAQWLDRLDADLPNLRAALSFEEEGLEEERLGLAFDLGQFWFTRGYLTEGAKWLATTYEGCPDGDPVLRARVLTGRGSIEAMRGDLDAAAVLYEEGVGLAREFGSPIDLAKALAISSQVSLLRGDLDQTEKLLGESLAIALDQGAEEYSAELLADLARVDIERGDWEQGKSRLHSALEVFRRVDHVSGEAWALWELGNIAGDQGMIGEAEEYFNESLRLAGELGDPQLKMQSLTGLAAVASGKGDMNLALRLDRESLVIARELGDPRSAARTLLLIGKNLSNPEESRAHYEESLSLQRELGYKRGVAEALENLGSLAARLGDHSQARTQLEEGMAVWSELGDRNAEGRCLRELAMIDAVEGEIDKALMRVTGALSWARESNTIPAIVDSFHVLGVIMNMLGRHEVAAMFIGASGALNDSLHIELETAQAVERDRVRADGLAALGSSWITLEEKARAMSIDEVINIALTEANRAPT